MVRQQEEALLCGRRVLSYDGGVGEEERDGEEEKG